MEYNFHATQQLTKNDDGITFRYKKCYESCETCSALGEFNSKHNCLSWKDGYYPHDNKDSSNFWNRIWRF